MKTLSLQLALLLAGFGLMLGMTFLFKVVTLRKQTTWMVRYAYRLTESHENPDIARSRTSGEIKQRPIGCAVIGWLTLGLMLVAATGYGLFNVVGKPELPRAGTLKVSELLDALKLGLTVVAGFGGVVALAVTYRKQRVTEAAHHLAVSQDLRDRERAYNERYIAASDQLGSDKFFVRITGAYAMIGLAESWDEQRETCLDVLRDYLRVPLSNDDPHEWLVRNRILYGLLARSNNEAFRLERGALDLSGCEFYNLDLDDVVVRTPINFTGAKFKGESTSFRGATFFEEVDFSGAEVTSSIFSVSRAEFIGTRSPRACQLVFKGAKFTCELIDFSRIQAEGASINLSSIALEGTSLDFEGSLLDASSIILVGAHLSKSDINFADSAILGGRIDLKGSTMEESLIVLGPTKFTDCVFMLYGARLSDFRVETPDLSVTPGSRINMKELEKSGHVELSALSRYVPDA